ncbi:unnamed protein product [Chrysoparadoxa australica]
MSGGGAEGGTTLRAQYDLLCKEKEQLNQNFCQLTRENKELKKSLYHLSYTLSQGSQRTEEASVFSLDTGILADAVPGADGPRSPSDVGDLELAEGRSHRTEPRLLVSEATLSGHTGAIYCAKFSPCGRLLASGSFDKSVRLWDASYPYSQVECLREHKQLVSDIAWSPDARSVISVSYDQAAVLWDTETGQRVGAPLRLEGLLQCVEVGAGAGVSGDPSTSGHAFLAYAGSTNCNVYQLDVREPMGMTAQWQGAAHINSLHVCTDGIHFLSADSLGNISTWDVRLKKAVHVHKLEAPIHISCIKASPPDSGRQEEEGQLLAATCFDNSVRVFFRRGVQEANKWDGRMSESESKGVVRGKAAALSTALTMSWSERDEVNDDKRQRSANVTKGSTSERERVNASTNANGESALALQQDLVAGEGGVIDEKASSSNPANLIGGIPWSNINQSNSSHANSISRTRAATVATGATVSRADGNNFDTGAGASNSYDRGIGTGSGDGGDGDSSDYAGAGAGKLDLLFPLRGPVLKNWPIRCSFFKGIHHRAPRLEGGRRGSRSVTFGAGRGGSDVVVPGYVDVGSDWHHSLVLATGSASGHVVLFDLSHSHEHMQGGVGDVGQQHNHELQTLRGHSDRVYQVDWHPAAPKLVSCSADRTLKVWKPKVHRANKA